MKVAISKRELERVDCGFRVKHKAGNERPEGIEVCWDPARSEWARLSQRPRVAGGCTPSDFEVKRLQMMEKSKRWPRKRA